jgi:hypothetical protein
MKLQRNVTCNRTFLSTHGSTATTLWGYSSTEVPSEVRTVHIGYEGCSIATYVLYVYSSVPSYHSFIYLGRYIVSQLITCTSVLLT